MAESDLLMSIQLLKKWEEQESTFWKSTISKALVKDILVKNFINIKSIITNSSRTYKFIINYSISF